MKSYRWILLMLFAPLILGCASGRTSLSDLSRVAHEADRIVLVEHSYNYHGPGQSNANSQERIYRQLALNGLQQKRSLALLRAAAHQRSMAVSKCIFNPHHRFEFYREQTRVHALEVCFECSQMELDRAYIHAPHAIYTILGKFVTSVGMEPNRNWYEPPEREARSEVKAQERENEEPL